MKINHSKIKEVFLGPLSKLNIPPLVINYNSVERVCGFKLLGVYISNDMSWNLHVDCICGSIKQNRLRRSRGELFALFIE